jgi:broad specificity phosphatase PhoE
MVAHMEALAKQHTDETILCVTHGKSIDMFVRWVLGLDVMQPPAYHIANASVTILNWQDGIWEIVTLNEIRHLEAVRA